MRIVASGPTHVALVGRDAELALAERLLARDGVRLLTLTGPPGVGKTRLALALAERMASRFSDDVVVLDLAEVRSGEAAMRRLAALVGVGASTSDSQCTASTRLQDRHGLIVLDTFEHLVDDGVRLARLLAACLHTKLLVTSRIPLQLRWEHVLPVRPLAMTPDQPDASAAAVHLFIDRARAADPTFTPTPDSRAAIAAVCAQLDGLPLAIELAAARVAVLPPSALVGRLAERLDVLVGRSDDLPERHRTLRAAIASSHNLLSSELQVAFRRLSVFEGGCTLAAAAAAVGEPLPEAGLFFRNPSGVILEYLSALASCNLLEQVPQPTGEPRFRMLESIRLYALEQLRRSGELDSVWQRWLAHIGKQLANQGALLADSFVGATMECEAANVRAALGYCLETGRTAAGLELAVAWSCVWLQRREYSEGRRWLSLLLSGNGADVSAPLRGRALSNAARLALADGDLPAADQFEREALAIWISLNDHRAAAISMDRLGQVAAAGRQVERAADLFAQSLARLRALDDMSTSADALAHLADLAFERGDRERAHVRYVESLHRWHRLGDRERVAGVLQRMAVLAVASGLLTRALRLAGAAAAQRSDHATGHLDVDAIHHVDLKGIEVAVGALSEDEAAGAFRDGFKVSLEQAISYAAFTADARVSRSAAEHASAAPDEATSLHARLDDALARLTRRERDVAQLLLHGMTNRQIGRELMISDRTAETHVCRILHKLQLGSRAQLVAWVVETQPAR